jgi:DUF177 domain-containing protein
MPRPPGASSDHSVDAEVCARAASRIERSYRAEDMPRLMEAGVHNGSRIEADFRFSAFDARPAIQGELHGTLRLTCQRCMQPVDVALDEHFQVLVVEEEPGQEPSGYEPVIADAAHLDLRWLAEEQTLLALPLVARHESQDCTAVEESSVAAEPAAGEEARQTPFKNLREMLRQR